MRQKRIREVYLAGQSYQPKGAPQEQLRQWADAGYIRPLGEAADLPDVEQRFALHELVIEKPRPKDRGQPQVVIFHHDQPLSPGQVRIRIRLGEHSAAELRAAFEAAVATLERTGAIK